VARGRRSGSFRRMRRRKADWVYRSDAYFQAPASGMILRFDGLGTYDPNLKGISVGIESAVGLILYDSANALANVAHRGIDTTGVMPASLPLLGQEARAGEDQKVTILGVEGVVWHFTSDWALGAELEVGTRIGVFEQDAITANVSVDPGYTMFGGNAANGPSVWANNGRNNAWERRLYLGFSPGTEKSYLVQTVKWRGRRVLEANECFAFYMERNTNSVNGSYQTFLRTLVAVE